MSGEQLELLWKVIVAVFVAGGFWNELKAIRRDIKRLEKKAEESNHLKERVSVLEVKFEDFGKVSKIGKENGLWVGKN